MTEPATAVWLVAGYSGFLVLVAYAFDLLAKRVAKRSNQWRTGGFTYHDSHDAWLCPEDQWLWPTTFDPEQRTMRYRASPTVCNACPVKHTCTTSSHGREVVREVDPWPHSEAGHFHRGIACVIVLLALLLPLGTMLGEHRPADLVVLASTAAAVLLAGVPLARHLWRNPAGFPEHVPHETGVAEVEALVDRYSTRWGFARSEGRKQA